MTSTWRMSFALLALWLVLVIGWCGLVFALSNFLQGYGQLWGLRLWLVVHTYVLEFWLETRLRCHNGSARGGG